MRRSRRYSQTLAVKIGGVVLRNPKDRGLIKFLAERLEVTPQTIQNWKRQAKLAELPRIGRPRASEERRKEVEALVRAEMAKQRNPGWRPIAAALPWLPVRLVQASVAEVKRERRKELRDSLARNRSSVEVLAREALWTIDGTQTNSAEKRFNQIVKDRGSLAYRAILSGEPATAQDIKSMLEDMPALPLVIASDNDKIYCGKQTSEWLKKNQVVHLKSLPRTPQHNGAIEVAVRELKEAVSGREITAEALTETAKQINEFRLRASKEYKTSTVLDSELPVAYSKVERAVFYEKCTERLRRVHSSPMEWREKRMAEREVIYATLEEYGLVKRRGGECSVLREKTKIFL